MIKIDHNFVSVHSFTSSIGEFEFPPKLAIIWCRCRFFLKSQFESSKGGLFSEVIYDPERKYTDNTSKNNRYCNN
ncbi:hypothetical protein FK85_24865 [Halorubrum saccharovorum]|uniref:Uncharacterized protein n=1 Tax=Halorubrum saccharovorum TaxID=2248 RepID=A0A0F8BI03_9EURY|nr:hypothetical protein FK85_24865 [Halorubrum saccharovorum]